MSATTGRTFQLHFHGRVIDHLGIQMYQSPVAAVAEMVSNSWDADAEIVRITLPQSLSDDAEIVIADNGIGMTYDQCEKRFLEVGYDRRQGKPDAKSPTKERPLLGRKGIGKFAGFGIAAVIRVETVSGENGERTVFELDVDRLRGDQYIGEGSKEIDVLEYEAADEARKSEHGTTIRLKRLTLGARPSPEVFRKSMARRFLLHQQVDDFEVRVNGETLPESEDLQKIQFVFPRDYALVGKTLDALIVNEGGWGTEVIDGGHVIRWRFVFYQEPIDENELRGVAVFAHGKLAQAPFDFNLVGGLKGQQGIEYLSGTVEADYLDELPYDVIAPERQRIDWNRPGAAALEVWGSNRIKSLLPMWQSLRNEEKLADLLNRLSPFGTRLEKLPRHERVIVERALRKLAGISRLNKETFTDLANAVLTSWEGGRLRALIHAMSEAEELDQEQFVGLLLEVDILTALHVAEAVRAKLEVVDGLRQRISRREEELPIRDYIAQHPWLISPKWDTFQRERSIDNVVAEAMSEAKFDRDEDWNGRIDLVLSSGDSLLILEFMRPGIRIDADHVHRFNTYVSAVRSRVEPQTAGRFRRVQGGYLIADRLDRSPTLTMVLAQLEPYGLLAMDWSTLLASAEAQWKEFIEVLADRAPNDERLQALTRLDEAVMDDPVLAGAVVEGNV